MEPNFEDKTHFYPMTIAEKYIDAFGHVNNAAYLSILEEARWNLIQSRGYGREAIKKSGLGPVVLSITINFHRELRAGDAVIIQTTSVSQQKKIFKLHQKILRGETVCCSADFTVALFDLKARKLVPPTKEWLFAIGMSDSKN